MNNNIEQDIKILDRALNILSSHLKELEGILENMKNPARKNTKEEECMAEEDEENKCMSKEESDKINLNELNQLAVALAESKKMGKAKEILQNKFGLGTLREAGPDKYDEIIKALIKLLTEE